VSDRLFFGLWPDDALRRTLASRVPDLIGEYPCKPQRPDQWHLTLEFLGNVEATRQPALHAAALQALQALSSVGVPEEELVFDRLEHWARPEVLCLVASTVPPALARLVAALRAAIAERAFEPERREFRPHLTLARKARRRVSARQVDPLPWPVRTLVLARSVSDAAGSRYEPLASWNIGQTLAPALFH
jgi:2'-5' RNA ligase